MLRGETMNLSRCQSDIIEDTRYQEFLDQQACASVYCGTGECASTDIGPACICEPGSIGRIFSDLDGKRSVTCAPDQSPVDLSAGGLALPDSCIGIDCGLGSCLDVGGFPTCRCQAGAAAALGEGSTVATCRAIRQQTGTPGAQDFSQDVSDIRVCAPMPPAFCGEYGWLVQRTDIGSRGEACASSAPDPALLSPPRAPSCEYFGLKSPKGCGCDAGRAPVDPGWLIFAIIGALLLLRRRALTTSWSRNPSM